MKTPPRANIPINALANREALRTSGYSVDTPAFLEPIIPEMPFITDVSGCIIIIRTANYQPAEWIMPPKTYLFGVNIMALLNGHIERPPQFQYTPQTTDLSYSQVVLQTQATQQDDEQSLQNTEPQPLPETPLQTQQGSQPQEPNQENMENTTNLYDTESDSEYEDEAQDQVRKPNPYLNDTESDSEHEDEAQDQVPEQILQQVPESQQQQRTTKKRRRTKRLTYPKGYYNKRRTKLAVKV